MCYHNINLFIFPVSAVKPFRVEEKIRTGGLGGGLLVC